MTQGGPLRSTFSVLYLMYEEGFRWWNLGTASAVAFLLFAGRSSRRHAGRCCASIATAPASGAVNARRLAVCSSTGLLAGLAASTLFPLLWMLRCRSCRRGVEHAAAADPAAHADAGELPRPVRGVGMGRYFANSLLIATCATLFSLRFNLMAGYALRQAALRGRDALFRLLLGALVIPAQVAMLPLFLMLKPLGLVNTYGGVIVPAHGRASSASSWCASTRVDSRRAARGRAHRRRRRDAHLPPIVVPLLRPVLVTLAVFTLPRHLERLHVAADRADRRAPAHAAGRAGRAVARARAGQRADDGRLGRHVLPVLLLFLALQRQYMQGLLVGQRQGMSGDARRGCCALALAAGCCGARRCAAAALCASAAGRCACSIASTTSRAWQAPPPTT